MDPLNRLALWKLIQTMKQNRSIILTTHSMEEGINHNNIFVCSSLYIIIADVLGDRIAIMAFGKLRCIGNSLRLKNKYGSGYRLHAIVEDSSEFSATKLVNDTVSNIIPEANLAGNKLIISRSPELFMQ
jgi:ABC-type multidrug transport system ATPase subunit